MGSHTSNSMWELATGLMTPCTLQNAASVVNAVKNDVSARGLSGGS
jgi:hypothetical protein